MFAFKAAGNDRGFFELLTGSPSKKGLIMQHNLPKVYGVIPQLSVIDGQDVESSYETQVNLEDERKQVKEQAEAEEFWAGRNLAARNSTRRAA